MVAEEDKEPDKQDKKTFNEISPDLSSKSTISNIIYKKAS
jgi:hypothetical protein